MFYKREDHQPAVLSGLQDHVVVALWTLANGNRHCWVDLLLLCNFCGFSKILSKGLVQPIKNNKQSILCVSSAKSNQALW